MQEISGLAEDLLVSQGWPLHIVS